MNHCAKCGCNLVHGGRKVLGRTYCLPCAGVVPAIKDSRLRPVMPHDSPYEPLNETKPDPRRPELLWASYPWATHHCRTCHNYMVPDAMGGGDKFCSHH